MTKPSVEFVVPLRPGLDGNAVGTKAANLGRLMDLGLTVPAGVTISRSALRLYLEESDLVDRALGLLNEEFDEASRAEEYKALCRAVLEAPIPRQVAEAAAQVVQTLLAESRSGIAVRSSGGHEDSEKASFAGVYESFLGICKERELWQAVRRCWCASWAPHAIDYARRVGVSPEVDGMAVLVQSLVAADSAGVLFTADPQTGNPWKFVLQSVFGLAQDLMGSGGTTTADRFLLEWDSAEILDRDIARKKTALVSGTTGIDRVDLPVDRQQSPSLTDDMARRIARAGLLIDRAFGVRVDVEWAVSGDTIHIVQARPLTALPEFFPHHLPPHLADRTWRPPHLWYFMLRNVDGTVTLPIYRDKLVTEWYNRYLQVGQQETPLHRRSGAELHFHGHRYLVTGEAVWPYVPSTEYESFLTEHEPRIRADFLHNSQTRYPEIDRRALQLEQEASTLQEAIDATLWARDEMWDLGSAGAGPAQHLAHRCGELLSVFVAEHLPHTDLNDLLPGHHPDLEPYQPHVMLEEAQDAAQQLGPVRERWEGLTLGEWIRKLEAEDAPMSFLSELAASCERLALVPPWRFKSILASPADTMGKGATHESGDVYGTSLRWHSIQYLRLIRSSLIGSRKIAEVVAEVTHRRDEAVAAARGFLEIRNPGELPRFDQYHDWALFWGPALNHRILRTAVPGHRLHRLFRRMREVLQAAGLVDDVDDVVYFTSDDLKFISETGDIPAGCRLLTARKHEYERSNRLAAPAFLGRDPNEGMVEAAEVVDKQQRPAPAGDLLAGKPVGPGRGRGTIRRVESLGQGDDVGGEADVVVLLNPEQSNNNHVPLLFSMLLRVRGLIVPDAHGMWTGHMSQIARECRVPVVRLLPQDLERLVDGHRVEIDGTQGIVTLTDE